MKCQDRSVCVFSVDSCTLEPEACGESRCVLCCFLCLLVSATLRTSRCILPNQSFTLLLVRFENLAPVNPIHGASLAGCHARTVSMHLSLRCQSCKVTCRHGITRRMQLG